MKERKTIDISYKREKYNISYVKVYKPNEKIIEFSEEDVYIRNVIGNLTPGVVNTGRCRVLWRVKTREQNLLGTTDKKEEDKLFEVFKTDKKIEEYSKCKASELGEEDYDIILYYLVKKKEVELDSLFS